MSIADNIYDQVDPLQWVGGDEKRNKEPVYDAAYDIDADDHNHIAKGLADVVARTKLGGVVSVLFSQPDATAGQADVALYRASGADTALLVLVAPWAGSVVGISVRSEGARTAGQASVVWSKNGSAQALKARLDAATPQKATATAAWGTETFAAGDEIGVLITTDGSWAAGATPSIHVDLFVAFDG